uniref:DH domain-containing protein n=1 Tax=Caenorhabditis tropicalis TaxID=1561998 RepID=A0A1I7UHN5_9PELO
MLSALSFLIHGKNIEKQEHNLKELEILYSINKNRPVRDANGNRFTSDELTEDLSKRITTLNLEAFRPVVFGVFEKLAEQDDALHYFVLVSTYRLTDEKFRESLEDLTLKQKLMTKIDGEFRYRLYSKPIEQNNIPQLAWDITPVLQNREVTEKDSPVSSNGHSIIKPVDEWGLISQEFRSILNCEELIQSAREGQSIEFFHLDQITFYKNLLDMHRGVSSDLFQLDSDNHFYQSKPCRVEEWNLTTTRTVHQKHIFLANQLSEVVRHLKDDFVFETSNSMRLLIQKYLIDEQYIFSDYFDSLLECSTNLQYRTIVDKLAEMLTTPDAELMELLTDAGDAKMIKDPSIWQRLNPLTMESSQCIDEGLANRVADLIIGYQFFIKDKKNKSQKSDESTFGISDIQDAEELELFAKTCNFEKIIDDILSDVDMSSTDGNLDELSTCINKLLEQVPTKTIVEKYSQIVLEKSVRFFEFLKTFFTSAYIHLKSKNILSQATLDMLEREKMHKKGYDSEFLKTVGYDMKSTMEDSLLTVNPPEPLNVFVTTGVTDIYSQVFTVLNMLHTALDAVIETKNSETLKHEPRLRYAFFHMNTTVFAIRKNMLSLIEASYETFMKTLDFKKPSVNRSSHQLLNVCYRAHRKFIRDVAGALMLTSKRGTTGRVIRLMVSSVTQASKACLSGDAVGADRYYQQFQTNLLIFLDQCRLDHTRYPLYRSLEIGSDEADGRRSLNSSYSDDLSCRSY